jgi:transcription termination/antitermination protein NusG
MPDLETAEMETPELESPEVDTETEEAPDSDTPDLEASDEPDVVVDTTEVDTVEIEPVDTDSSQEAATTEEAPVQEPQAADGDAGDEDEAGDEGAEGDEADAAARTSASPYDMPGDWYVIHSYSGYENKVKANLETRIQSMHMEDRIYEVHIPMEDVVEFKGGKKVTVPKKVFPGYILVRMLLDDDSWYAVRNTPGVTGFVAGNAQKPTPLSRREVERFLGVQEEEEKAKPRFKPEWEVGEQVRVVTGPFADFNGVIEDMNVDQQKIVVLVNIFGRDTPVELGFEDIQKS